MKLSDTQIAAIAATTGANPIPEEDPAMGQLKEAIGDHTFYVDQQGLLVLEDTDTAVKESELEIVRVGQWADEQRSSMGVVPPQPTGQVIDLDAPAVEDAEEADDDGAA